jgi:hypothetical protein
MKAFYSEHERILKMNELAKDLNKTPSPAEVKNERTPEIKFG